MILCIVPYQYCEAIAAFFNALPLLFSDEFLGLPFSVLTNVFVHSNA